MTHHFLVPVFVFALLLTASTAAAQLRLSEPQSESDQDERASDQTEKDLPTSSRLRKSLNGSRSKSRTSPSDSSTSLPVEQKPVRSDSHESLVTLLTHDAPGEPFFSGPVPRTTDIGEDATLHDVCHVGSFCWAVGERGVVCFSSDGGESWNSQFISQDCSLRSVCFLTNKIGWIAGFRMRPGTSQQSAVLMSTRDGGLTWTDLAAGSEPEGSQALATSSLPGILRVQFFGLTNAIAITPPVARRSGAGVFRTDDGGVSWLAIPSDQPGSIWTDGSFLSESEGVVVGRQQSYATVVSDQTVVINPPQPSLRQMRSVSLDPDGTGWMAGDGATILTTNNSGVTWSAPDGEIPRTIMELTDLHAVAHSGDTILLAGNPASQILRSDDSGQSWESIPLAATGIIQRLRFLSESEVVAVGSFGQILRSDDRGQTWSSCRSSGFRSGILNFVTDADHAAWQMIARCSGEEGVRCVTLQLSQPLSVSGASVISDQVTNERTQSALAALGGNEAVSDWLLPRTKPEHHRSGEQLIAEWNRQTDGQLQRLLPLRIARDLRNWRPNVAVIESVSDDDAVASILADALRRAMIIAETDDEDDAASLRSVQLPPWSLNRVVTRTASDQRTSLSFDDADLLPALGTTSGLICDAISDALAPESRAVRTPRTRSGYELLFDRNDVESITELMEGIEHSDRIGAVRSSLKISRDNVDALRDILQKAQTESAAAQGGQQINRAEESMTAELQNIGQGLPETLAVKQLRDLANLNLQQNNMEGYLAVQQEIIRRHPASDDGRKAAEMLFLFYSSEEARYFRLRTSSKSQFGMAARVSTPAESQAIDATSESSQNEIQQPEFQTPESISFSASASNPVEALQQKWDSHAATAFRILSSASSAERTPSADTSSSPRALTREISPMVLLRHAANQRLQDRTGEQSNALAELSQRADEYAVFANSEMQLNAATVPGLPVFNLPRRTQPPFLDGQLTDSIWEDAQEISLQTFRASSSNALDAGSDVAASSRDDEPNSLVMLAWDDEFLYFSARFSRTALRRSSVEQVTNRSHDAKHQNRDRLELEIDTDRDFVTAFHLTVDEAGLTSDRCLMLNRWNPKWFVATDSDDDVWRVEAAIPFSELATRPAKPGDLWSVKLRRVIPGALQQELVGSSATVSTQGTALVRFIRPKAVSNSGRK